mgnify:CR=1 FL=1
MLPSVWRTRRAEGVPHVPVLPREVVDLLDPRPGATVVDGTFGAGGHARLLAEHMGGRGAYIGIDRDPTVVEHFRGFRDAYPDMSIRLLRADFRDGLAELVARGVRADAVLLDLGVSSMQIDDADRGFAYATDAPLDMRMDPEAPRSAADLVNTLDERALADIFHRFGEERYARPIARAIVRRRATTPYTRSHELVETIRAAIPAPAQFGHGHPAKRVFQALRIAVNDELAALEEGLAAAIRVLRPGGRLVVLTYHSLEDRIVKRALREAAKGCTCPPSFPICRCGKKPSLALATRHSIAAGESEIGANPRARSARLRAAVRLEAAA